VILLTLILACSTAPPPDPCGDAWAEMVALRDGLWAKYGAVFVAPEESAFRATCEALPADKRACFAPTFAAAHPECDGLAFDTP